MKMRELWKDIPGYYGLYRVSSSGRVKSLERVVKMRGVDKYVPERYLKPSQDKDGYLKLDLSKDGKQKGFCVHRLVAQSFIKNQYNKPYINHIDNNPSNNHYLNLEWCTQLENVRHCISQGRKKPTNRKLSNTDVEQILLSYLFDGTTMDKIAEKYNVTRPVIGGIINNKTYKNVSRTICTII